MRQYEQDILAAGKALADATLAEMVIEDTRPIKKVEAIGRIIGTTNHATGKPHSASSAEALVELDGEYAEVLKAKRAAVYARIVAKANYEATLAAARLGAMEAVV